MKVVTESHDFYDFLWSMFVQNSSNSPQMPLIRRAAPSIPRLASSDSQLQPFTSSSTVVKLELEHSRPVGLVHAAQSRIVNLEVKIAGQQAGIESMDGRLKSLEGVPGTFSFLSCNLLHSIY